MGERTQYAPGTFSWADLSTPDQDGAKAFYGALFGWEADDMPMGDDVVYSMMQKDGEVVSAISPQQAAQREQGLPAMWNSYVTVESADASAERADELGATVHAPPFDVFDAGRMAVIQDPQGAFFMVWEARNHPGAALVNAPGALSWDELASPDLEGSSAFYAGLFGWTITPIPDSPVPYLLVRNGEANNGGIRPVSPPGTPPHWLVYFGAEDVESALATAGEHGGATLAGPFAWGSGKIAVARDPQGAVFGLYAGEMEP